MPLLGNIDPTQPDSTGKIFRVLVRHKEQVLGPRIPWSIAELGMETTDYNSLVQWLKTGSRHGLSHASKAWAKSLDPQNHHTNPVVCGLVLHALFCEHVRRFGTEGNYWGIVRRLPWDGHWTTHWFTGAGQPTNALRDILEESAQTLRLRNVFGIEGTFEWFSTGYLQFGFTLRGLKSRLPEWLARPIWATHSIRDLSEDGTLRSQSFADLWRGLVEFRRGNLNEVQLRVRMQGSPWILPEWHDEIIKGAKRRLDLGTGGSHGDDGETRHEFLSEPLLKFGPDGVPCFELSIVGLAELTLPETSYRLTINGTPHAQIIGTDAGEHIPNISGPLELPWQTTLLDAAIESNRTGDAVAGQNLHCWHPDEIMQVFREGGSRCADPFRIGSGGQTNRLHLWTPTYVTVEGSITTQWISDCGNWTIRSIDATQPATLTIGGQEIWSLAEARRTAAQTQDLATSINIWIDEVSAANSPTRLHVSLPPETELRWARIGSESLPCPIPDGGWQMMASPDRIESGVSLCLGLRRDVSNVRHQCRVPVPFGGAVWFRRGKHQAGTIKVFHSGDSLASRLIIRPPGFGDSFDSKRYMLLEGNRPVRRIGDSSFCPGVLAGLGAPLELHRGPYNDTGTSPTVAAEAVINGGLIHQVKINGERTTLYPLEGIELRPDFIAIVWTAGRGESPRLHRVPLAEQKAQDDKHLLWVAQNGFSDSSIYAAAVVFEGQVVGSWWNLNSWTYPLASCRDPNQAEILAGVTRALRAPILYANTLQFAARFVHQFPGEVLSVWLADKYPLDFGDGERILCERTDIDQWRRAVGELFEQSNPVLDLCSAGLLLDAVCPQFATDNPTAGFVTALARLSACSPLLAMRFAQAWLRDFAVPSYGSAIAGQLKYTAIQALTPAQERVIDFCENAAQVDDHFVTAQITAFAANWPHVPGITRRNLMLLFQNDLFRRLAAAECLRRINLP